MARTYHGRDEKAVTSETAGAGSGGKAGCRAPGLRSLVAGVAWVGGVVMFVMMFLGGKCRCGKHHHQQCGDDEFLHG